MINGQLYIKRLLSVVKRVYLKSEVMQPHSINNRDDDLLICVLEGNSIYEVDGDEIHLGPGDVLYLAKGSSYKRVITNSEYSTVFVYFQFDTDIENKTNYHYFPTIEGIELAFIKLYKKWTARLTSYQSECMSVLYDIYAMLANSQSTSYFPPSKRDRFDEIMQKISENYTKGDISVANLAKKLGMSEVHFRRCFKKIYNVSPQEYITALRIHHAKELLQYDSCSVEVIAQTVGFWDSGYFSRLFKIKTGYAPTEYRKNFNKRS